MDFKQLVDFIENKMSMSHVYQPLLIRALVDADGSATIRQVAHAFLNQDESQLLYYEKRIKEMPLRVLRKHGVVQSDGDLVSLTANRLSLQQKAKIRMLCEQRMQDFIQKRGLRIWDYRLMDDPVPDSLRYKVLKASDGRCALCGATKKEQPLDVDHIIPRSRGGRTIAENLQVLCAKCNRSKGNKDATDFRDDPANGEIDPSCPFCSDKFRSNAVQTLGSVFAVYDSYPVTDKHVLVVTRRHTDDFFSMTERERGDANILIRLLRTRISEEDSSVVAFNVGANCGEAAGQTIPHAHIHLIPRRHGDTPRPRGGVRGVIPGKMGY